MGIWGALVWKEWLGLRWKMAALAAIPTAMLLGELAYDWRLIPEGFVAAVVSYVAIAPIFLAMHTAAAERVDGTLEFVRGLPYGRRRMGLIRLMATLVALLAPLVGTAALAYGIVRVIAHWDPAPLHEFTGQVAAGQALLVALGIATSIYLWTAAMAMNQPSELRAGAIGVVTLIALGALFMCLMVSAEKWEQPAWGTRWLCVLAGLGPFGSALIFEENFRRVEIIALLLFQTAAWLVLAAVAASRYANLEVVRWGRRTWLSGRTRALFWAQWRQLLPLGVLAIASVLALTPVNQSRYALLFFGSLWAIIVGVTMFTGEFEPRLYAFWRSRPIDPSAWFRIKYIAGALVVLLCFDLPGAWLVQNDQRDYSGIVANFGINVSAAYLVVAPLLHLSVYSVAVAIVCFVRQAIYAGILSMSAMLVFVVLPALLGTQHDGWHMLNAFWLLDALSGVPWQMAAPHPAMAIGTSVIVYVAFQATAITVATLAAWSSVEFEFAVRT